MGKVLNVETLNKAERVVTNMF